MVRLSLIFALCLVGCAEQPKTKATKASYLCFTASWCGPCKQQKPEWQRLQAMGYKVVVVDIDKNRKLAANHRITSVPTTLRFENQKETGRWVGVTTAEELVKKAPKERAQSHLYPYAPPYPAYYQVYPYYQPYPSYPVYQPQYDCRWQRL